MSSEINLLLEKATSPLLLDIDWDSTLHIVDLIRQGDVYPKAAVQSLVNRLKDTNPNVVLLALQVFESVVKNCGQSVHEQVAIRSVMKQIYDIVRTNPNEEVRKKILLLLATWVYAFRNESKYRAVQDTVNILKAEGFHMPTVSESDAMFTAVRAPDWADGECCHRCRSQFTMLRRKHHCRACGQVFCPDCSSKYSTIPKFGIEHEVRVCESCFDDINNPQRVAANPAKPEVEESSSPKPAKASNAAKECSVCNEDYNEEERCPRCLPCIHSLCTHCIQNLITRNSKLCPFCRQHFNANSATDLKVNTGLLDLLRMLWEMEIKDQTSTTQKSEANSNWREELLRESEELIKKNISDCRKVKEDIDSLVETNSAIQNSLLEANDIIRNEIIVQMNERLAKNKTRMVNLDEKKKVLLNQKREIEVKEKRMHEAQRMLTESRRSSKSASSLVNIESINTDVKTWLLCLEKYLSANKVMHQKLEQGSRKTTDKIIRVYQEVLNSEMEEEMDDYVPVLPDPPVMNIAKQHYTGQNQQVSAPPNSHKQPNANRSISGPGAGGQGDYSAQWADYYRSMGMHREAEKVEKQAKSMKVSRSRGPTPNASPQQHGGAQPAAAGGGVGGGKTIKDYSQQWIEYYRALGMPREADAIEAHIKASTFES